MFYVDMGHFFDNFFLIFYVYDFWDSHRKKKKGDLLIGQPQGSLSERRGSVMFNLF